MNFFFLLDLSLSVFALIGFYHFIEEFLDSGNMLYSSLIVIFIFNAFISQIVFTLTTFNVYRQGSYNYFTGFIFMTLFDIILSFLLYSNYENMLLALNLDIYFYTLLGMMSYNLYVATYSHNIIKYY